MVMKGLSFSKLARFQKDIQNGYLLAQDKIEIKTEIFSEY